MISSIVTRESNQDALFNKQGRIRANAVANGWTGAVFQKSLTIQKCYGGIDGWTERTTWQGVVSCVHDEKDV